MPIFSATSMTEILLGAAGTYIFFIWGWGFNFFYLYMELYEALFS